MSWIKRFYSVEEGHKFQDDLIMELTSLEHDGNWNPIRLHSLRVFRSQTSLYVDAAGTKEQVDILRKLDYEWSDSEHPTREMELVFEQSEDN